MIGSLRELAHALGGKISGGQVIAPGPGHSRTDESMSVKLSPFAPEGFIVCAHSPRNDWRQCRDYVRERLGLKRETLSPQVAQKPFETKAAQIAPVSARRDNEGDDRIKAALGVWDASADPRGTPAETYLASRRLALDAELAGNVLRWNARLSAMVALFRNIVTGEPRAISRTYLDANACKVERKFLGPVGGAAIQLDAFDAVTAGLHIAEGLESAQAARQLGLRPTWALGSASAIASFPVLGGVETLTILAEHDAASARAVEACGSRWHAAGREVLITKPFRGKDLNDVLRGDAS